MYNTISLAPVEPTRQDVNPGSDAWKILYVLDKMISRMKFVGVLKNLVADDAALLSDILSSEEHFHIVQVGRKYEFTTGNIFFPALTEENQKKKKKGELYEFKIFSSSSSSTSSDDTGDLRIPMKKQPLGMIRVDSDLSKAILILEGNPKVQKLAAKFENELSIQMKCFIKCLKGLRENIAMHLGETAEQEKERLAYLRECYIKNEKAKKEIDRLEKELLMHKTDANYCIIGRNVLINRHQNKISKIQKASLEVIEKKVKESERAMANDWKMSTILQESLKEELQSSTAKFEVLLKEDLAAEKVLRAKRAKVENQLLGWLQKFDQDIGEKQTEEEEVQRLLDKQNAELKEIWLKLEQQEAEYDEIMQEKAEYQIELLERTLYMFILNRSARRIQRYFRMYKEKKSARKSKRDRKGRKAAKKE